MVEVFHNTKTLLYYVHFPEVTKHLTFRKIFVFALIKINLNNNVDSVTQILLHPGSRVQGDYSQVAKTQNVSCRRCKRDLGPDGGEDGGERLCLGSEDGTTREREEGNTVCERPTEGYVTKKTKMSGLGGRSNIA